MVKFCKYMFNKVTKNIFTHVIANISSYQQREKENGGKEIMNVVRGLKTLAVALPLSMMAGKASAQASNIVKSAEKIVVGDTAKAAKSTLDTMASDAKTYVFKKYNGHFKGNVKGGKIADGTLEYAEAGKTMPLPVKKKGADISIGGGVFGSQYGPSIGYRLDGAVEKSNNLYEARAMYSSKGKESFMSTGAFYSKLFPVSKDVDLALKGGADCTVKRLVGTDHYGILTPQATAGVRFHHKFANGGRIGAKAEAGAAYKTYFKDDVKNVEPGKQFKFGCNGEIEGGGENVTAFANGGIDPIFGANAGGGVRVKF